MEPVAGRAPRRFSLNDGGPFFHLLRRLGLLRPDGMARVSWIALFAWFPMALGQGLRSIVTGEPDPMLVDLSEHARLLVAIPSMLFAERLVEPAARSAISTLYAGGICDPRALDRIVDSGERMRDKVWPEVLLAAVAVLGGQLTLWRVTGALRATS